jgi:uncharacterized membrane protein YbhN (UPF0104 family)
MKSLSAIAFATAVAVGATGVAAPAFAAKTCGSYVRHKANRGALIGGVAGAVVGNAITDNATGTVVGAGVGALAGHEIAKSNATCSRRYAYHHHRRHYRR